jgi:PRTRC genetic system ThiF family protein
MKLELFAKGLVMLVGCGGTGGFLAEGLCRLLPKEYRLALVDHDRVEESNLGRQNFYSQDLGRFKAQVLAERLSLNFNREIFYDIKPVEEMSVADRGKLTIGCVDNPKAREMLQYAGYNIGGRFSYSKIGGWYIDAGNSEHSGQVLIGNCLLRELHKPFGKDRCYRLPLPQIQQPALLAPQVKKRRNCAEAVRDDEQSPVINQAMAALLLQMVYRLINGELDYMAQYIDLEAGTLSTVPAEPETVARMLGVKVTSLVAK